MNSVSFQGSYHSSSPHSRVRKAAGAAVHFGLGAAAGAYLYAHKDTKAVKKVFAPIQEVFKKVTSLLKDKIASSSAVKDFETAVSNPKIKHKKNKIIKKAKQNADKLRIVVASFSAGTAAALFSNTNKKNNSVVRDMTQSLPDFTTVNRRKKD